ncbi:hypothetical protein [Schlesneria paludicola]|uniref:hypothetical protein n=1 Tax=Schlesneria paludicola TaxID=360056 RepID=UPI00029A444A|nr:hypothetical protein [Schlesneria paludicola]
MTTGTAICLSIATVNSVAICDGPNSSEIAQPYGKTVVHEGDFEDRGQYPGLTFVKPGLSTKAMRKQAIAEVPLNRLSPDAQKKSQSVLNNLGMYRRLPTISFECDPDVYHYFLKNPDVAVSTWRAMDISQFQLQQTGLNHYRADAGDGSVGDVELFLQTPTEIVIHCDGAFKSPLLPKPIVARSLMRLQTTFVKDSEGRMIGTHSGDVFVEFPSHAVEAVAKVIAPVSHNIADRNFKQMTLFVHLMSQAMARHPGWIEQIGNKLDGVSPQKKVEFLEVSARSTAESRRRMAIAAGFPPFSPEEVLTPFRQAGGQGKQAGSVQLTNGSGTPRATPATAQAGVPPSPK